jgi:hypothetical protein
MLHVLKHDLILFPHYRLLKTINLLRCSTQVYAFSRHFRVFSHTAQKKRTELGLACL